MPSACTRCLELFGGRGGLDAKHAPIFDQLKASFGDAFDRAHLEAMLTGHKEALERYTGYAANGDNANLRKLAGK